MPSFPGYFQQEPYFDVANIQVLRGQQGTIVGQNATGGAVFVNTNDPVIGGEVTGYIQGQVGNYADVGLQGAVNLPVSDTLAVRVALFGERRDGFYNITGPARKGANNDLRMAAGRLNRPFDAAGERQRRAASQRDHRWLASSDDAPSRRCPRIRDVRGAPRLARRAPRDQRRTLVAHLQAGCWTALSDVDRLPSGGDPLRLARRPEAARRRAFLPSAPDATPVRIELVRQEL